MSENLPEFAWNAAAQVVRTTFESGPHFRVAIDTHDVCVM